MAGRWLIIYNNVDFILFFLSSCLLYLCSNHIKYKSKEENDWSA